MKNIYKLKFEKSSFDLDKDYESIPDHHKEKISKIRPVAFFDFNDKIEDRYTLYMILSQVEINEYITILKENGIGHRISDISDEILRGEVEIDEHLMQNSNRFSKTKVLKFIDKKNEWIYDNLDIDTVLDRISDVGMESLRHIEKKFLENYHID
jgi:hypothetical protein